MYLNRTAYAVALGFLCIFEQFTPIAAEQKMVYPLSYTDIADQLIPALGLTAPQVTPEHEQKVNFTQPISASDYEQYATVFELFQGSTKHLTHTALSPLSILMHDLNMFCFIGKDVAQRKYSLFSKLNEEVTTLLGEASLAYIVSHPTADITELERRQKAIKAIVDSPHTRLAFEKALINFKQHEPMFLACYKNPTRAEQSHVNRLFFQRSLFKKLNSHEWALGLSARWGDLSVLNPIILLSLTGAIPQYISKKQEFTAKTSMMPTARIEHPSLLHECGNAFVNQLKSLNIIQQVREYHKRIKAFLVDAHVNIRELEAELEKTSVTGSEEFYKLQEMERQLGVQRALSSFFQGKVGYTFGLTVVTVPTLFVYWWIYKNLKHQIDIHTIDNHLHQKMINCAELVRTFDTLMHHAQDHPELQYLVSSWKATCTPRSASFEKLVHMLRSNTFTGKPSFFSRLGRVRAAYTLLMETRAEFGDMMRFIGMCDAYLAVAKLYTTHQNSAAPYSFAHFIDQKDPYINAEGFWNPMIAHDKVVTNDLELGISPSSSARIALVTGSNSGGKSTIMVTGLTSAILLAQTCGIAPAHNLTLTPFDYIATSLKVQDNVAAGKSHFVAETEHAAMLVHTVRTLGQRKSFIAIDELFEGTVADVGESSLYDFITTLAGFNNVLLSVATQHQGKPTMLEADTNGLCKNMKVDVVLNSDGTITRLHKLSNGISSVSVGAQLFQEAMAKQ